VATIIGQCMDFARASAYGALPLLRRRRLASYPRSAISRRTGPLDQLIGNADFADCRV
jgi:hypothetical protein